MPTIVTMFNKGLYQGDFDHCGIIIKDQYGSPYIYELTYSGAKLYPYSARVIRSKARQIIIVPILYPFQLSEERREKLLQKYKDSCSEIGSLSYLRRFLLGIASYSIASVIGPNFCSFPHSPECSFALDALKDITGNDFDKISIPKSHTANYKSLMDEINMYSHIDNVLYVR